MSTPLKCLNAADINKIPKYGVVCATFPGNTASRTKFQKRCRLGLGTDSHIFFAIERRKRGEERRREEKKREKKRKHRKVFLCWLVNALSSILEGIIAEINFISKEIRRGYPIHQKTYRRV